MARCFQLCTPMNDPQEQLSPCLALVPYNPPPKPKHPGGRPTVMTPETIDKLEYVFALGGTDKEACLYADISLQALYDYQTKHPEFVERKELLKSKPILKARTTLVEALKDPETAKWYLTKKRRREFDSKPKEEPPPQHPVNVAVFNDTIDEAKIQRVVISIAERAQDHVNGRGVRGSKAISGSGVAVPSEAEP